LDPIGFGFVVGLVVTVLVKDAAVAVGLVDVQQLLLDVVDVWDVPENHVNSFYSKLNFGEAMQLECRERTYTVTNLTWPFLIECQLTTYDCYF
jgi:hypothetical protein